MELKTTYSTTNLSNGRIQDNATFISSVKCNNLDIITDKVKIKSKRGQSAMRTKETDYIIFDISIRKHTLYAIHEPLTTKQAKSKKIAFVKVALDNCFSLDENLQSLYDECVTAILDSEFFTLS